MIIYIDKTIGDYLKTNSLTDEEKDFFLDLATSNQRGKCLLCGDVRSIDALIQCLDQPQNSLYYIVNSKYTETKAIIGMVEVVLAITYGETASVPEFIEEKARIIKVHDAIQCELNTKSCLIGENLSDCQFYTLLGERYVHQHNLKEVGLSLHNELGGGQTTSSVFRKCIEDDRVPTLCVADSDIRYGSTQKYPNNPAKGKTVLKIESTLNEININIPPIYELYPIPIHEAENLIPIEILESLSTDLPDLLVGVSYLTKLRDIGRGDAILYYDFKEGMPKLKEPPAKEYWNEIANLVQDGSFPKISGNRLLQRSIKRLTQNSDVSAKLVLTITLDGYLQDLWEQVGRKVFSWGCVRKATRA